jgi:hypothetical protein
MNQRRLEAVRVLAGASAALGGLGGPEFGNFLIQAFHLGLVVVAFGLGGLKGLGLLLEAAADVVQLRQLIVQGFLLAAEPEEPALKDRLFPALLGEFKGQSVDSLNQD